MLSECGPRRISRLIIADAAAAALQTVELVEDILCYNVV